MKRADRQHLNAVMKDLHHWAFTAAEVSYLAWHAPLSWPTTLPPDEEALVTQIQQAATTDLGAAERLIKRSWVTGRHRRQTASEAAARLAGLHAEIVASGDDAVLEKVRDGYRQRFEEEREQLSRLIEKLAQSRAVANQILSDLQHMPLTRDGLLPAAEIAAIESLVEIVDLHEPAARRIVDQSLCAAGSCPRLTRPPRRWPRCTRRSRPRR